MKTFCVVLVAAMLLAAAPLAPAEAQAPPPPLLLPDEVVRVVGGRVLVPEGRITGFAFGPGRQGIAYCFHSGKEASLRFLTAEGQGPYQIWGAPPGAELAGPVRWAPEGLRIAFRQVNKDGTYDLLVAPYQGGTATAILKRAKVTDYLWSPDGKSIACLLVGKPWPALGLISSSGGAIKTLASAAADVRWSPDSASLSWLEPSAAGRFAGKSQTLAGGPAPPRPDQPMRPPGSLWSPDGLLCAALLTYGQAPMIFPSGSSAGRAVPGLQAARLLAWSPDSKVLLGQDVRGSLFSASALPAGPGRALPPQASQAREVTIMPMKLDLAAGPPSGSADGSKIALVLRPGAPPFSPGGLILVNLERIPLPPR
jgi:Tol biopolymer transport system component